LVDPKQEPWDYGDCVVQADLHDGIAQHLLARPRHTDAALRAVRDSPPQRGEAPLLRGTGQGGARYVDRVLEAGILCPFRPPVKADTPERSE
jgi:hypothetical protein